MGNWNKALEFVNWLMKWCCYWTMTKKKMKSDEEDDDILFIPPEVVREMLSWLPLKPLARAQLVCKQWRSLIQDHRFMEKHMKRSSCVHHWYNVAKPTTTGQADYPKFSFIHGFHGLLLMKNVTSRKYFLWNPAARLSLELPHPHTTNYGSALCFVPSTRSYKIVSLFKDALGCHGCQLLTPGPSMAWRELPFPDHDHGVTAAQGKVSMVPAGGAVHYVLPIKVGEETVAHIITLDVETELFIQNRMPRGVFGDIGTAGVLDWNGKLAFYDIVGQDMQLMVLKDYKKNRWCREKDVIHLPFLHRDKENLMFPLFRKEGEIWFRLKHEKIFAYTIDNGGIRDVERPRFALSGDVYCYKPSFITFEGMQPDKELQVYRPRLQLD